MGTSQNMTTNGFLIYIIQVSGWYEFIQCFSRPERHRAIQEKMFSVVTETWKKSCHPHVNHMNGYYPTYETTLKFWLSLLSLLGQWLYKEPLGITLSTSCMAGLVSMSLTKLMSSFQVCYPYQREEARTTKCIPTHSMSQWTRIWLISSSRKWNSCNYFRGSVFLHTIESLLQIHARSLNCTFHSGGLSPESGPMFKSRVWFVYGIQVHLFP